MAKRKAEWENKSRFKHARSVFAVGIVLVLAAALILTGVLMTVLDRGDGVATVSNINLESEKIGMTANLDNVFVKILYSDGSSRNVALSELMPEGLDLTYAGRQTVTINYGNQQWSLPVEVVSSKIKIEYVTSDGGYVEGDDFQEIPAGESGATVRAVPNEGYYFDGWDDGIISETRSERSVSQNRTIRALFKRNAYTVAFQRADGRWDEQTVLYGDPAVPPDSHTWKMRNYGYKFVQWDRSVADSLSSVTRNLLVRGEYEQYHSKFSVSVTGNPDNVKDRTVSAANHTFGSDVQTEDKNSTVSYVLDGKSYTRRANVYTGFYEWEASPASVIAVNAAQDSVLDCWLVRMQSGGWQKIEVGGSAKILLPGSGGDESDMSEFSAAEAENGVYKLTFTLQPLQDKDAILEVVAVMEYERNDILFYNRSDHVKTVSLPYASTLTEADFPVLEITGFEFNGWTVRNSNTWVTTETYFKETTIVDAQWTPKQYTVNFTVPEEWQNKGCDFEELEFRKEYLSTLGRNFPPNSPACDGYDFAGWFVEGVTGGSAVTEATVVYDDMVLVPSFTPKRHTVRFEISGGNGRVYAVKNGGTRETVGSGTYIIEEPSSYVFSVEWDTEYVFSSLAVDGTGVAPQLTGNSFVLNFNKAGSDGAYRTDKERTVTVNLANSVFALSFENGSGDVRGKVTVAGDYGGTFDGGEITVDVPMHAQVMYTVTAPKGYVIDTLTVDGAAVDISVNTSEYTGLMGDILAAHSVEITYAERTFNIKIKDGDKEEDTVSVKSESPFEYEITAPADKYAAKVTINGRSVDLYRFAATSSAGYYIDEDSLKVNMRNATAGEIQKRDARVTNAKVKIAGVAEDADIVIEYADLEYTLTFRGEGYGSVLSDATVTVKRNRGWAVVLSTETGYYIAGYRKSSNDVVTAVNYNSFASDYTEEISNVTEDADYTFIFARRTFSVIFSTLGGDLNISAGGETTVLSGSVLKDYSVEYGASARFTLSVKDNVIIKKVRIISDSGAVEEPETGTVESSYTLVLDKITDGYRVIVTVSAKPTERGDGVLVIEKTTGGKVTAPMGDSYTSGDDLELTVIPESGYEIRSVVVSSAGRFSRAISAQSIVNGKFTVASADTASAAGAEIKVSPVFAPKNFDVTLSIGGSVGGRYDGEGKIAVGPEKDSAADKVTEVSGSSTESVAYGSNYYVYFIAEADSIISEIKVDGVHVELNSSNLEDYTMTSPDGGYSVARISVRVSGETTVTAVFRKETFNVTVANSYNGTTEIVNASGGFLKGESVLIGMTADTGYHITGLYIDGIKIDESLYLNFSGDDAKLNTAAKYTYENISRNVTVVAQYEMNYYSLGFTAVNTSPNFAEVNTAFGSYGSVNADYKNGGVPTITSEIDGRANYNATFANIAHGTNIELNVRAAYTSGYYIKNLSVQMLSGGTVYNLIAEGNFASYDENAPCYATGTVYNAEVGIRGKGGITADVYSVSVEFTRAEYKVSAIYGAGAEEAMGNPLNISFVNSYNNGQTAKVKAPEASRNYYLVEFGIQATVMVTPPSERLRLTSLIDNISKYDYTYNVIGNRYTGLISRDVSFIAGYEVRQMNITLTVSGEDYGSANIDGFSGNTATLPYGSELRLILIPETAKGGIIDALRVNGGSVSLVRESGVYYYVIEGLTTDIDAQAFFELEKFGATQSVNVTAGGSVSLTDGAGNNLNNNEIPWGDTLSATITVNRAYNLVSVKVNDADYSIDDLHYEELNGIRRFSLEIRNVQSPYAVSASFELKTFDWEATFNAARGDVYIADESGNRPDKLTANRDVYLYVKPSGGYMVSSVSARMQGFDGVYVNLTLDAEYVNEENLDERRYLIENVTGIVDATVEFGQKEFAVKIDSLIGYDGFERMSLTVSRGGVINGVINLDRWNSSVVTGVRFGDTVTLVVKARDGYDIMGVSVNGMEYLAGRNDVINYNVTADEYSWTQKNVVDDKLVNNRDENGKYVIGGNSAYELKFTVASERDSFEVKPSGSYEGIADVSYSDRMSFGSRNTVIITAHEGYSITSVYISSPTEYASGEYDMIPYHLERVSELRFDLVVDGSCGVFHYNYQKGVMSKYIYIEINAEINSYNQSVAEYVHDNEMVTTDANKPGIASHTTAYYIKEGHQIPLENATSVEHFLEVTVETNPLKPQEYEFWGFQEYIAGRGWTGEIENISYAGGSANKFTYIADRARSFRAVYVRRYTVQVEIVPFHKYLSGSYIPETGTFMGYATYGAIGAAITDPFGLGTSNAVNVSSTNANYVYEVCYGDALSITATDSNTQNRSRSVNYYAEKEDGTLELLSSGSMGMSLSVDKNMRIYAAYDNNIQFAMTTEAVGGERAGEGATVEYSVGGSLRVMQNNAFSVAAFDKVTVKVTLDENYRFDGLLALEAQNRGDLGTLIWTSTWDTLFDFNAVGENGVVNDRDTSDNVTHTQDGNVITFEFTVTENSIYKLVLHRMFRIEISENDGYDNEGEPVPVVGGASIGTVTNNRAPKGWYDYGATVELTSTPINGSQFVGWFINRTNYFNPAITSWNDAAAETHNFTLSGDRVSGAVDLDIRAEYLPIYTLNIYSGLEYADGTKFYGSTNLTSVNAVIYSQGGVYTEPDTHNPTVADENFNDVGNSMEILSHIVNPAEKDNLSKASNKITLTVRPNASFVFDNWSVKVGTGEWEEIDRSNETDFVFDLVEYLYKKGDTVNGAARDIHFRANITKNNIIRVSKVVYYDAFGVISPSNGIADNSAYVGDMNTQTVSTVEYGTSVTVGVRKGGDYDFLGWFDITDGDTNSITEIGDMSLDPVSTDETYSLSLLKGSSTAPVEGYTYYLEARFMRKVTITFAVENNSANGNDSFRYQVPVIRGTESEEINYAGNTVTTVDTSDIDTSTDSVPSLRHSVKRTMYAGSCVAFELPTDISKDGFSPANHKYLGLSAGSYVERGENGEYYVMFDRNRTITVLYGAYGTINLQDILPHATVTFGEVFTGLYLDQNRDASGNPITVNNATYSLTVSGGLTIVNKTAQSITVSLPNMPKVDYQTDLNSAAAASYEQVEVHINPMPAGGTPMSYDISVGFSYGSEESMTLDYSLVDFGQMPFARGAGTAADPYIVSNLEQFGNVGKLYELSGNSFGATYRYFAMETRMRNGSQIPDSQKFMYLNGDGGDWTPLCSAGQGFDGVFDFKEWEIGGLTGNVTEKYFGVFARLNGATIKSFNFGGKNNVTGSADYVGLITGYAINTVFEDINVKDNQTKLLDNNTSVGTIGTTGNYLGLVAGYAESCTINSGIYIYSATVAGGGDVSYELGDTVYRNGLYVGAMFGRLKNTNVGTTSNNVVLAVNNVTVGGHRYIGGVAGYFEGQATVQGVSLISGTFGTQNVSGDVGGLLGYVVGNATVRNVSASQTSDSNSVTVNGFYRYIGSVDIENNNIEQYLYGKGEFNNASGASSVGGLIGRLDGTLDGAEIGGSMQIYGSVAGGMVGFNRGTVRNLRIYDTGRVLFDLRYGGVYGGMIGYNEGLVSYAVIGRVNKYKGLSEDMGRIINYESSDMASGANVVFKTEGSASGVQGSGASSIYSPASGTLFEEWGGLAMGGVVGYNVSRVYNSVTYGKVVHYKKVHCGSYMLDALGGIVGMNSGNSAEVRACGTSYGIVLGYTVINVSNQMQTTHSVAAGGVIGSHSGGIAFALFSFHSAVSSFTNAGVPGDGYVANVVRVAAGAGGLLAAVPGTATAQSNLSWGYYTEKSYNGSYFGAFVLGSQNAVSSQTLGGNATTINAQNMSGNEPADQRFNILPTDYNYNTYVNANNGNVYNVKAKSASLGDFRYAAAEDRTRAGYRVRDYFNEYAKVYAVNDDGRPTSTLVPWQYSDNN